MRSYWCGCLTRGTEVVFARLSVLTKVRMVVGTERLETFCGRMRTVYAFDVEQSSCFSVELGMLAFCFRKNFSVASKK